MSEENNNTEMFAERSSNVADSTKKVSEDALGLGPKQAGRFMIGFVDRIVGEGGLEVPGFVATKDETLQLVRYWATEITHLDFAFFLYGSTGSSEWRTREFANRRLTTISALIGEEDVNKAFRQAEHAFANGVDPRAWRIFTQGTKQEQEHFQQEVLEELARDSKEDRE